MLEHPKKADFVTSFKTELENAEGNYYTTDYVDIDVGDIFCDCKDSGECEASYGFASAEYLKVPAFGSHRSPSCGLLLVLITEPYDYADDIDDDTDHKNNGHIQYVCSRMLLFMP